MIPVLRPVYGPEEAEAVRQVLESGWSGLGPRTKEFEQEFAKYAGAKFVAGTNSGTSALHLALEVLNLASRERTAEVIVPTLTFVSTVQAVILAEAIPVFADCDPVTLCVDPEDIRRKISPDTAAIIGVDFAGHPCDWDEIKRVAARRNIPLIADAAHACGAEYKGMKVGSVVPTTCFSFHAVKNLSMGEGGAITTDNQLIDERLRRLRWMGISRDTHSRAGKTYDWHYEITDFGYKYHLSDIAAAIGLVQLKKLDTGNLRRREIATQYSSALQNVGWLQLPTEQPYAKSSWHLYVVRLPDRDLRDKFIGHLKSQGVGSGVHYVPIHQHPYFKRYLKADCPVADREWERLVSLPIHLALTYTDVEHIISSIKEFSL
jgi:perosamine synthetase